MLTLLGSCLKNQSLFLIICLMNGCTHQLYMSYINQENCGCWWTSQRSHTEEDKVIYDTPLKEWLQSHQNIDDSDNKLLSFYFVLFVILETCQTVCWYGWFILLCVVCKSWIDQTVCWRSVFCCMIHGYIVNVRSNYNFMYWEMFLYGTLTEQKVMK